MKVIGKKVYIMVLENIIGKMDHISKVNTSMG